MYNLGELLRSEERCSELARQVEHDEPATLLRSLKIKIISTCNLRCEMCKYWRMPKQSLDRRTIFAVLESAASLGCSKVHFSGGEVTLHPHLDAVIARGSTLGMRVNLTSNGILMDRDRARRWIDADLRSAAFSLDGVRAKTHDRVRGVPGAFKRTVRAIRTLGREIARSKTHLRIRVNMVLSRRNLNELPALIRLAGDLGVVDVLPMPIDGCDHLRPSAEEIHRFNQEVVPEAYQARQEHGMPVDVGRLFPFGRSAADRDHAAAGKYGFGHYESHLCYAPWLHAFISHTGDVFACCMTRDRMEPLGNVVQTSMHDIFQGARYRAFRQSMRESRMPVCGNCDQYLRENRLVDARLEREPRLSLPHARTDRFVEARREQLRTRHSLPLVEVG